MGYRNYVATVKEREEGQPCFVQFELYKDIDFGGKLDNVVISLNLPDGTGIREAKKLADALNDSDAKLKLMP